MTFLLVWISYLCSAQHRILLDEAHFDCKNVTFNCNYLISKMNATKNKLEFVHIEKLMRITRRITSPSLFSNVPSIRVAC